MSNYIWCIVGRSGSGKDTLLDDLLANYYPGRTKVISKTTRAQRYPEEACHVFASEDDLREDQAQGKVVAYNYYAGNHYWATSDQIDAADFYIVDVPGLVQLKRDYKGDKTIKAIGLKVTPETSIQRMCKRGDDPEKVFERASVDDEAFRDINKVSNLCLSCDNLTAAETAHIVADFISTVERRCQKK